MTAEVKGVKNEENINRKEIGPDDRYSSPVPMFIINKCCYDFVKNCVDYCGKIKARLYRNYKYLQSELQFLPALSSRKAHDDSAGI